MSSMRDAMEITIEKFGFWKPFRVTIWLPGGICFDGRGWKPISAFVAALRYGNRTTEFLDNLLNDWEDGYEYRRVDK